MKVLVSGGGTVAPVDDVRSLTNGSTGRFAAAISEAALEQDARMVWHLAPASAAWPYRRSATLDLSATDLAAEWTRLGELHRRFQSVVDRYKAIPLEPPTLQQYAQRLEEIAVEASPEVFFLAMAASDYEPIPRTGKLRSDAPVLRIDCRPCPKVIASVRAWAPRAYLVGFKLLSGSPLPDLVAAAQDLCLAHRLDLVVANDWQEVRAGKHSVHLVNRAGLVQTIPHTEDPPKRLVDFVFRSLREETTGS
jgi:phosphopantothenate---cysteine ligase (CTP)